MTFFRVVDLDLFRVVDLDLFRVVDLDLKESVDLEYSFLLHYRLYHEHSKLNSCFFASVDLAAYNDHTTQAPPASERLYTTVPRRATRSASSSNAAQSHSSSDNPTTTVSASHLSAGPRWMSSTETRATWAGSRQGKKDGRLVVTGTKIVRPSSTTPPINKTAVALPAGSITSPTSSGSMWPSSTAQSSTDEALVHVQEQVRHSL